MLATRVSITSRSSTTRVTYCGNQQTWKRRWFVLRPAHLAYYKTPAEYKLLRLLEISEIHAITPVTLKRHENTFGIVTRARTFYLQAESQDEVEAWVTRLNEAKDGLQSTNSAGAVPIPIANPPPPAPSAYQAAVVGSPSSPTKASPNPPQLIVPPSPKIVAFSEPSSPIQANANKRNSRTIIVTSSDSEIDEPIKTPGIGTANSKDASKLIMSGYLMKCGSKRKTWRKRWFVLSGEKMIYTGSHMVRKGLGHVRLECDMSVPPLGGLRKRAHGPPLIVLSAVWAEVRCGLGYAAFLALRRNGVEGVEAGTRSLHMGWI